MTVDNSFQTRWNRIGHIILTWLVFPVVSLVLLFLSNAWLIDLKKETFWLSMLWGPSLAFMAAVGYGYYFPKGFKFYFYVTFGVPAVIGVASAVICLGIAMHSGLAIF